MAANISPNPVFTLPSLDSVIHLCETAHLTDEDLPGPPYWVYYRPRYETYEAYLLDPGETDETEFVGVVKN